MEKYLYIAPFENKKYFKIGISSKSNIRLLKLKSIYNLDLDKTIIFTTEKKSFITIIENELLTVFPKIEDENEYKNLDGSTEIRDIQFLEKALSIINGKSTYIDIIKNKFYDVFSHSQLLKEQKVIKQKIKRIKILDLPIKEKNGQILSFVYKNIKLFQGYAFRQKDGKNYRQNTLELKFDYIFISKLENFSGENSSYFPYMSMSYSKKGESNVKYYIVSPYIVIRKGTNDNRYCPTFYKFIYTLCSILNINFDLMPIIEDDANVSFEEDLYTPHLSELLK